MSSRLSAIAAAAAVSVPALAVANVYTGGGLVVPDNVPAGVTSVINVPDSGPFTINSVKLNGATHSWVGDLIAKLTTPQGVTIDLFNRVGRAATATTGFGDSSDLAGDYTFADGGASFTAAALAAGAAAPVPPGTYQSEGPGGAATLLSGGNGPDAQGNWTLFISDNAGGDTGGIQGWTLDITVIPEPTSFGLLSLGVLPLLRRRRA
jgi:subtilisin-like proprotein convertase family protein